MWIKKKKINILEKSIEKLSDTLEEGNYIEWAYILGNKKEIIKRNLLARNCKRSWNRNRSYYYYSCIGNITAKNCNTKHPCNRRIYRRYCGNSGKK